jgi:hypothetical protein
MNEPSAEYWLYDGGLDDQVPTIARDSKSSPLGSGFVPLSLHPSRRSTIKKEILN